MNGWIYLAVAGLALGYAGAQEPVRVEGLDAGKKPAPMSKESGGAKEKWEKEVSPGEGKSKSKESRTGGQFLGNLPHRNREKEVTRFGVISNRGSGANKADPLDPGLASWNDRKPVNCAPGCDCRNERFIKGSVENNTRSREVPKAGDK